MVKYSLDSLDRTKMIVVITYAPCKDRGEKVEGVFWGDLEWLGRRDEGGGSDRKVWDPRR